MAPQPITSRVSRKTTSCCFRQNRMIRSMSDAGAGSSGMAGILLFLELTLDFAAPVHGFAEIGVTQIPVRLQPGGPFVLEGHRAEHLVQRTVHDDPKGHDCLG